MVRYNPSIIANLKPQDFIDQIDALKARKEEILAFFDAGRLASKPKMRAIIEARFKDLDRIRGYYEVELSRTARQIKPRTLKSPADMYREFTEDEVNDFGRIRAVMTTMKNYKTTAAIPGGSCFSPFALPVVLMLAPM